MREFEAEIKNQLEKKIKICNNFDTKNANIEFSSCNIQCICTVLENKQDCEILSKFINSLDITERQIDEILCLNYRNFFKRELYHACQSILRSKAFLLFKKKKFTEMMQLIKRYYFDEAHHKTLQFLWYNALYELEAETRNRSSSELTSVDKFRIRKNSILPLNIWDGEPMNYFVKRKYINVLNEFYAKNRLF
ncbi:hypothetical protein A3Q56_02966 [Intoshia linei]|uniref:Homeobox protein SIX1 N-terminal SD domain-containing protein n=1 Tax=Intoshia linei TaxID=1819745 RepID=A0A177B6K1_9BILA|nr:hypothetical protein A3Q56_02966 [Intoshia linei]